MEIQFNVQNEVIWICLGISIPVLFGLCWLEVNKQKPWLWARCLALVLILLVFNLLIWQPSLQDKSSRSLSMIVTEGVHASIIDSLQKAWDIKEIENLQTFSNKEIARLIQTIKSEKNDWVIVGNEIPTAVRAALKKQKIIYYPNGFREGWQSLDFPSEIKEEQTWELRGQYFKEFSKATKLRLQIAGNTVDSLILLDSGFHNIAFNGVIEIPPGKYLFDVVASSKGDTVYQSLPVVVKPKKISRYLIISGFPNFEWKYIKDFFGDQGDEIFYSTKISKDKYKVEAVNSDLETKLEAELKFTDAFLENYDVCLIDISGWQNLTAPQKKKLKNLNEQKGLGLILLTFGEQPTNIDFFSNQKPKWKSFPQRTLEISTNNDDTLIGVNDISLGLQTTKTFQAIFEGDKVVLAMYTNRGFGKQAIAVWPALYPFVLQGRANDFQIIYKQLVKQLHKPIFKDKFWQLEDKMNTIGNLLSLGLRTSGIQRIEELTAEVISPNNLSFSLAPAQNRTLLENYDYTYFPADSGWHQLRLQQDTAINTWLYIQKQEVLSSLNTVKQIKYNIDKWGNAYESEVSFTPSAIKKWWMIPQWYFFAILLLSLSFLWLMDKIYA